MEEVQKAVPEVEEPDSSGFKIVDDEGC